MPALFRVRVHYRCFVYFLYLHFRVFVFPSPFTLPPLVTLSRERARNLYVTTHFVLDTVHQNGSLASQTRLLMFLLTLLHAFHRLLLSCPQCFGDRAPRNFSGAASSSQKLPGATLFTLVLDRRYANHCHYTVFFSSNDGKGHASTLPHR